MGQRLVLEFIFGHTKGCVEMCLIVCFIPLKYFPMKPIKLLKTKGKYQSISPAFSLKYVLIF